MGRKPKFMAPETPADGAIYVAAVDALLGREDDRTLTWNVSLTEILNKVRTTEGIAELAKVSAKTVHRAGIRPNSRNALQYVRDARRELWRPLVSSSNPLDWRNLTGRYIHVLNTIIEIRRMKDRPVDSTEARQDPRRPKEKQKWRGKRKLRIHHWPTIKQMTSEEMRLFDKHVCYYSMVSIAQVCCLLKMSRRGFEKWMQTVPLKYRKVIRILLLRRFESGRPPTEQDDSAAADMVDSADLRFGFSVMEQPLRDLLGPEMARR
jgi:hypothetical protein